MCIMSIGQEIYAQYRPVHQTIYSLICLTLQYAKHNDRQMYHIYGTSLTCLVTVAQL